MSRIREIAANRRGTVTVSRIVAVMIVALLLAGCGKKGNPSAPADQPNTYPRSYPSD